MISINVYCCSCQRQYQFIKDEDSVFSIKCEKCGKILLDSSPIKGFIYILSNPSMPDLLKIGFTTRSINERIAELNSSTGVPENFVFEAYFGSIKPEDDECLLHRKLNNYRTNKNREFFKLPILDAIREVGNILGKAPDQLSKVRIEELELKQKQYEEKKVEDELKRKREEARKREEERRRIEEERRRDPERKRLERKRLMLKAPSCFGSYQIFKNVPEKHEICQNCYHRSECSWEAGMATLKSSTPHRT